jgi:hypothetical protein
MLKRASLTLMVFSAVLIITAGVKHKTAEALSPEPFYFYSLDELLDSYVSSREGRIFREWQYLEHMKLASLENITLLTNLPEIYRITHIEFSNVSVRIYYDIPYTGLSSSYASFVLDFCRSTPQDRELWGHTSPLDGIMQRYGFTENDLIDGKYIYRDISIVSTLHWAQGSNRISLSMPSIIHGVESPAGFTIADLGLSEDFTVHDLIKFAESVTIDMQDEANLAAWSIGDYSLIEELLNIDLTPPVNTLRFTVGSNIYSINGREAEFPTAPFISEGRVMIPFGLITRPLNATTAWDDDTRTTTIARRRATTSFAVDVPLPDNMGTPVRVNNTTFVPIRYISEALGAEIRWDADNQAVYIMR